MRVELHQFSEETREVRCGYRWSFRQFGRMLICMPLGACKRVIEVLLERCVRLDIDLGDAQVRGQFFQAFEIRFPGMRKAAKSRRREYLDRGSLADAFEKFGSATQRLCMMPLVVTNGIEAGPGEPMDGFVA